MAPKHSTGTGLKGFRPCLTSSKGDYDRRMVLDGCHNYALHEGGRHTAQRYSHSAVLMISRLQVQSPPDLSFPEFALF